MSLQVILSALLVAGTAAAPHWTQLNSAYSFDQYKADFDKSYTPEDEPVRREAFELSLTEVIAHNTLARQGTVAWHTNVSEVSDMTDEEFMSLLGRVHTPKSASRRLAASRPDEVVEELMKRKGIELSLEDLPKHVDWRERGVISPPQNQGRCGSCWAFGAAATIESYYALASGSLTTVSAQQMLDCTQNPNNCGGSGGCQGGVETLAFQSVIDKGGIDTIWTYPYISYAGEAGECRGDAGAGSPIEVKAYYEINGNDYEAVMKHLAFIGPLSASVDASSWKHYKGGVFKGCPRGEQQAITNHAVQLIGYGEDPLEGPYWIIKNSWGTNWGERGFMRIARMDPNAPDFCRTNYVPEHGSGCVGEYDPITICDSCGIISELSYVRIGSPTTAPVNPDEQDAKDDEDKEKKEEALLK